MRWKEQFLVEDHRVRQLHGASFDGFYYICLNQITGSIQGIYYHQRSDRCVKNPLIPTIHRKRQDPISNY